LELFDSSLLPAQLYQIKPNTGLSFFKLARELLSQFNHGLTRLSLKSLSQLTSWLSSYRALEIHTHIIY
ncbi:hypothetical protein RclHR1_19260001, partial [Rhizophagus clarus]